MTAAPDHYRAVNITRDSENRIHSDDVAREYGFQRALVPGAALFAYVCESIRGSQGKSWAEHGYTRVRYLKPVYDGERLQVSLYLDEGNGSIREGIVNSHNARGDLSVSGIFSSADMGRYSGRRPRLLRQDAVLPRPMSGPELLRSEELASVEASADPDGVRVFLSDLGIDPTPYEKFGAVPLSYLMHMYLLLYQANFRWIAPSVNAGTETQVIREVRLGERLSVRSRIDRLFRRKGKSYLSLEIAWYDSRETPVLWAVHTAAYDLGAASAGGLTERSNEHR